MSVVEEYHKKTILKVVPTLNLGGVERGVIEIARKIIDSGGNSIVISNGGKLVPQLEEVGATHIQLNVDTMNPFTIWCNIQKIADIINKYNIDIVHVHSRAAAWSCYKATKLTNAKLLTTFHGIYSFSNPLKKYYNSIMTKGALVIAVSHFVKKHILDNYHINENKIRVIHRGVNHSEFNQDNIHEETLERYREKYNVPIYTPILLIPSRITRWKGHLVLIDALSKIQNMSFYCIIAGDLSKYPEYVEEIKDRIYKHRIQKRVQLFGEEIDIAKLYAISDIVLSTSIEPEAFGRSVIEGQAMKKLVISSNIGGALETIEDGKTGFHFKAGDAQDLANKIKHCLSILGTEQHQQIVERARQNIIDKFCLNLMLPQVLAIYDELYNQSKK
ncbi:MAG: glycosyltransferase family 4 protein [Rickettsiaceae bacterium]|nr:glycosyltransferase family 4 protein [Rickettsiaceae bacterium]